MVACPVTTDVATGLYVKSPTAVRERLSAHEEIVHSTIEIHRCTDAPTEPADELTLGSR